MSKISEKTNDDDSHHADSKKSAPHDETKSPKQLEQEVDQARARLGSTASELSDRLSPGELIDQALGMAREHGGELGRNLGSQVKNNPIPMILTSVGISWMMLSSGDAGQQSHATKAKSQDSDGQSFMGSFADKAEKSRDKASEVGERMQGASANAKESVQNTRDALVHFYRDQPLLAGSVGIAIGAALGALIPPTDLEDDMLGETSDRGVAAAKSQAASQYDELRE